jgi:hypothetical protein
MIENLINISANNGGEIIIPLDIIHCILAECINIWFNEIDKINKNDNKNDNKNEEDSMDFTNILKILSPFSYVKNMFSSLRAASKSWLFIIDSYCKKDKITWRLCEIPIIRRRENTSKIMYKSMMIFMGGPGVTFSSPFNRIKNNGIFIPHYFRNEIYYFEFSVKNVEINHKNIRYIIDIHINHNTPEPGTKIKFAITNIKELQDLIFIIELKDLHKKNVTSIIINLSHKNFPNSSFTIFNNVDNKLNEYYFDYKFHQDFSSIISNGWIAAGFSKEMRYYTHYKLYNHHFSNIVNYYLGLQLIFNDEKEYQNSFFKNILKLSVGFIDSKHRPLQ